MAEQSLAVKYRPKSFDDLTEQGSIKQILLYQISTGTIKNGYLFTGPAGCGKTTSARIFANMINKGQGLPIELDAASNNSVDDIRDICEQAQTKSLDSEYKVFIIDECHVLSNQAWQAMLKTLEEPPAKSIFVLCTTNPEKIPATILSRVQRYNFQKISAKGIEERLKYICDTENDEIQNDGSQDAVSDIEWAIKEGLPVIQYDEDAIAYLSRLCSGGMRDGITLMDKCLSYSKELTVENVVKALGVADYEQMFQLNSIMFAKDVAPMFNEIDNIYNEGIDLKQYMNTYFEFLLDIMKYQLTGHSFEQIKIPSTFQGDLDIYGDYEFQIVRNLIKLVLELNHELKWQKDVKPYIEAKLALFMLGE